MIRASCSMLHRTPKRTTFKIKMKKERDFPGGLVVKNLPANAGGRSQSLVWEDPTWHRATKPVCHDY